MAEKIKAIKGGHTYVVDIYNLKDEEKTLVFGDILRTIYNLYAESDVAEEDLPKKGHHLCGRAEQIRARERQGFTDSGASA
ncbi:MAG: hypothetical protein ABSG80_00075 [Verrucomicrobiota bacterium]